uniref:Uncharacterized protein n=1 Tax=Molossus molossus TaxID=27622 RepID=A0A7J8FYL6_MOLMO|nr:hypothetical protein HJG59_008203 [Molossus molossus]
MNILLRSSPKLPAFYYYYYYLYMPLAGIEPGTLVCRPTLQPLSQTVQGNSQPFKTLKTALAGLAQRLEHRPAVQRDPGSVPTKGMYLGCSLSPALVGSCGWQPLDVSLSRRCFSLSSSLSVDVSLSLSSSLSLPLYLNKKMEKMSSGEDKKKNKTLKTKDPVYILPPGSTPVPFPLPSSSPTGTQVLNSKGPH